jgi:hypothetical protein
MYSTFRLENKGPVASRSTARRSECIRRCAHQRVDRCARRHAKDAKRTSWCSPARRCLRGSRPQLDAKGCPHLEENLQTRWSCAHAGAPFKPACPSPPSRASTARAWVEARTGERMTSACRWATQLRCARFPGVTPANLSYVAQDRRDARARLFLTGRMLTRNAARNQAHQ